MKYWQKKRNYRKYPNADGTFTCTVTVDGQEVEVSAEVYAAYSRGDRRERYQDERDADVIVPLSRLDEDLTEFAEVESAENTVFKSIASMRVGAAFERLDPEERRLIRTLVIDGATEREYAKAIGLSQKGVNKRKSKILKKMFEFLVLKP